MEAPEMRRIILILTLLILAAPTLATVTITLEVNPANARQVLIGYVSDEPELIRAFALDITVTDGNIIDVNDYAIGDDNGGYGIFPGSFADAQVQVNPTTGEVDNWGVAGYSPVAPAGDPDALGGIGTGGVTIEMGSLYDTAAPSMTGILCSVTVDEDVTDLCVEGNAIRGSVVLESAVRIDVPKKCLTPPPPECFDSSCPEYPMWVKLGKPDCWCCPYQCHGDADCLDSGMPFKYRVYIADLTLIVNNWKKKATTADLDPCADFDHKDSGMPFKYQVYIPDLAILVNNWKKKEPALPDCPCILDPWYPPYSNK
jgi:hypothetical protein